ncbi:alpha/beta fold hydrolase [Zhihengliuella halotolerans]|uniref:Pimeloyl-ACP methyl ester carboxylesterase n=1 Tax=Zhihengliuella halotolerans TaxID=370736 RepID=A0A4Q8ABW9_9MICC|nr:alpha/beta fold hydrolase [Zhihengliuella halotolerans]RZU61628.1 pimeloyl-ACP methyl ester carboxylesterase [Zhihengliuella halotolerans]
MTRTDLIRVETFGEDDAGVPVLLIHGFASSIRANWESTGWLRHLTEAGRRVVAVELPGHGDTAAADDWAPADLVEAIAAVVEAHGGTADVIGYSLGARLGWELAGRHPALVRRLVLGGAAAVDPLADFDTDEARRVLDPADPAEAMADALSDQLLGAARAGEQVLGRADGLATALGFIAGIQRQRYDPASAVPTTPTLAVAGDQDELAATSTELLRLVREAGGQAADLVVLPGRTHANAVTARGFKRAATEFLAAE